MLSAFIEERHDDVDTSGFAVASGDDTLQILVVVIRRHVVGIAVHVVSNTMIAYIGENEQILTADGLADLRFGFTASETGHIHVYEIVALDIAVKGRIVFHFVIMDTLTEFYHVVIDAASHFFCGRQSDDLQRSHGHGIFQFV